MIGLLFSALSARSQRTLRLKALALAFAFAFAFPRALRLKALAFALPCYLCAVSATSAVKSFCFSLRPLRNLSELCG
jgi:hypothetical protein